MAYALIDADSIYFRAAFARKRNDIRKIIKQTMAEIEREVMSATFEDVTIRTAVKGYGNFRKDLYPEYKANRPQQDEEMRELLTYAHQHMVDNYGAVMADGMEADDLVSIWAYEAREAEEQYVVVGIDKDLLQIPGNHYNFVKKTHEFVDDDVAYYNLMLQCLTGDNTDNIPGIKGVGPAKAKKLLGTRDTSRMWNRVRAAWKYANAGDPGLSWRLLAMLKSWEEFDEVKSQIAGETPVSKQDVLPEQEQNDGVS